MFINQQQEINKSDNQASCLSVCKLNIYWCISTVFMTVVPLGGMLLEGVEHLSVVAELTDEAFLSTQTAAENMGAGKLDHFGQEGGQFSINHLAGEERKEGHFGENTHTRL